MIQSNSQHQHSHDEDDDDGEHQNHDVDPHIWLEPSVAKQQVHTIAKALIDVDGKNKDIYEKNRDSLLAKLSELEKEYQEAFSNVTQKTFATQHAAFGYIANKYHLEQLAISNLSDKEPSAQDIARVVSEIKEHQLSTIYVDPSLSSAVVDTVARETGVSVNYLYTIERQVDNLDYIQLLKANLEALKKSIR